MRKITIFHRSIHTYSIISETLSRLTNFVDFFYNYHITNKIKSYQQKFC